MNQGTPGSFVFEYDPAYPQLGLEKRVRMTGAVSVTLWDMVMNGLPWQAPNSIGGLIAKFSSPWLRTLLIIRRYREPPLIVVATAVVVAAANQPTKNQSLRPSAKREPIAPPQWLAGNASACSRLDRS
jgi:hypothetical protein